jgi:hypothetical protein
LAELRGRRITFYAETWPPDIRGFEPGDYMLVTTPQGTQELWFKDPVGMVGRCVQHTLTEHEDGTITADPSILDVGVVPGASTSKMIEFDRFHGWLRRGIWSW